MLKKKLIMFILSACLVLVSGTTTASNTIQLPDLGSSAQAALPKHVARQYGANMLHKMHTMGLILDDALVNTYINEIGYRLAAHSSDPSHHFSFFVVKSQAINAFAAPGGYIGINAGLFGLTQSESELAAVMAHEIGHITQHHLERAFEAAQKEKPLAALVVLGAIVAGATDNHPRTPHGYHRGSGESDAGIGVLAAGMGLIQQRQINFTRGQEVEADSTGIKTLAASGYNPDAMAAFFKRMQSTLGNGNNVPPLLLDHPVTTSRIASAKARAKSLKTEYQRNKLPPISTQQWKQIVAPSLYSINPNQHDHGHSGQSNALSDYALIRERVRVLSTDPIKALDYYQRRRKSSPSQSPSKQYGYALALIQNHQPKKAITILKPLVQRYPSSLPLSLLMAKGLVKNHKSAKAQSIYKHLNALRPGNKAIIMQWAKLLLQSSSEDKAKQAQSWLKPLLAEDADLSLFRLYARASEQANDHFNAAEAWANVSYLEGRPFDAMEQLQRLLTDKHLDYYQRAKIKSDINQIHPLLLELKKRHIQTSDRPH